MTQTRMHSIAEDIKRKVVGAIERDGYEARGVKVCANGTEAPSVYVSSYDALVRVTGFLRYAYKEEMILLRRQVGCHRAMVPSLYRVQGHPTKVLDKAAEELVNAVCAASPKGEGAKASYRYSTEAMLQHYGLSTRWLDLVDSLPHALFFATHDRRLIHLKPWKGGTGSTDTLTTYRPHQSPLSADLEHDRYGVIYALTVGKLAAQMPAQESSDGSAVPGVWTFTDGSSLCDLRRAKPSTTARPHAQHGYLFRGPTGVHDLWSTHVLARIFVPRDAALSWLGNGIALNPKALFPSWEIDDCYRNLLSEPVTEAIDSHQRSYNFDTGGVERFLHHLDLGMG